MKKNELILVGILLCAGLIVLGICINKGLQSFSNKERVVTVKGLAEKQIKATEAKIILSSSFSGDVPKELVAKLDNQTAGIQSYLKGNGYENAIISDINLYDSKDYYEWDWVDGKRIKVKKDRYRASKSITVMIANVEDAEKISKEMMLDLVDKGLTVDVNCDYTFPELNTIKPELIAESTKNARTAGEQFAKDSQSKLGKIKTASQGQITIAGR
ncbi:MAG: SIMPL domain-containing protein, partial [Bacteroidales bacterium]|nr:SIMPL domain-containing protein [Bacteroidales bacterium]